MNRSIMMKILCCLVTILISSEAFFHHDYFPWRRTQLTTVTHFFGIEEFYLRQMRLQRSKSLQAEYRYPSPTADSKKVICNKILSNHTRVANEFWLNTDLRELRHELKRKERNIYNQIYERPLEAVGCFGCSPVRVYTNGYVVIDGFVDDDNPVEVQEYAFKCLARTKEGRHLVQYYVTEEYNVNVRRTKKDNVEPPFIAARFVFYRNEYQEWRLLEMAEESALLTGLTSIYNNYEKLYLIFRKGHKIVQNPDRDPVCGMPDGHKVRMCVSMWNTSKITGGSHIDPQFVPEHDNLLPYTHTVSPACVKRKVRFTTAEISQFMSAEIGEDADSFYHEEWTILCHVENSEEEIETRAVSRGYSLNSIFVFKLLDDDQVSERGEVVKASNMVVDHHSYHVSVVDDWVIQVPRSGSKKIEF